MGQSSADAEIQPKDLGEHLVWLWHIAFCYFSQILVTHMVYFLVVVAFKFLHKIKISSLFSVHVTYFSCFIYFQNLALNFEPDNGVQI